MSAHGDSRREVAGRASSRSRAYTVPTDAPEADGTLRLGLRPRSSSSHAHGGGETGLGYTYADVVDGHADRVQARRASSAGATRCDRRGGLGGDGRSRSATSAGRASPRWRSPRSTPRSGTSRRGCSGCRSCKLLGMAHERVPVYGCGGFTVVLATPPRRAARRLGRAGDPAREDEGRLASPSAIPTRVRRGARGDRPDAELFVDANGALLAQAGARRCAERVRGDARRAAGSRSRSPPTTSRGCG